MKKLVSLVLAITFIALLVVCSLSKDYNIRIVVPAGSQQGIIYSDEEISPIKKQITISSGEGLVDTEIVLKPVEAKEENTYEPIYLTAGMPVEIEAEKGAWFKIGLAMQNPTNKDMIVYVNVLNVEVRIE